MFLYIKDVFFENLQELDPNKYRSQEIASIPMLKLCDESVY